MQGEQQRCRTPQLLERIFDFHVRACTPRGFSPRGAVFNRFLTAQTDLSPPGVRQAAPALPWDSRLSHGTRAASCRVGVDPEPAPIQHLLRCSPFPCTLNFFSSSQHTGTCSVILSLPVPPALPGAATAPCLLGSGVPTGAGFHPASSPRCESFSYAPSITN